MKSAKYFIIFFVFLAAFITRAEADMPPYLNFQGKLTDDTGQEAQDGNFTFIFTLYEDASGTTPAGWSETKLVNVESGLYSVVLGTETAFPAGIFSQPLWLKVTVNGNELSPLYRLTSSPYSFYAATAAYAANAATAAYALSTAETGADDLGDHTATQNLNINGNWIVNVTTIGAASSYNINFSSTVNFGCIPVKGFIAERVSSVSDNNDTEQRGRIVYNVSDDTLYYYYYQNPANSDWIPLSGDVSDNLGNHVATTTLDMAGYDIISVSSITLTWTIALKQVTFSVAGDTLTVSGRDYTDIISTLTVRGNVNVEGSVQASTFVATGADLAEIYPSPEQLEPGDVVVISRMDDLHVVKSNEPYDTKVAGVVSTNPGSVLGAGTEGYKIALAGRVPVKVNDEGGEIMRGDLLTTSSMPGYAMKAENPRIGTIIGKALEDFDGFEGKIMVLITLQ